jgi:DNA-binding MarR family transcriptional regulator
LENENEAHSVGSLRTPHTTNDACTWQGEKLSAGGGQPSAVVLSEEVIHKFLRLNRFLRQRAHQMDSQGIRPRQFAVLRFLLESGPATVGQVQGHLYLGASTTSVVIAGLEEAGYVTRTRSEEDNRVVLVELTPAGREIAQNTPLGGIALLRRRLGHLPAEKLRLLDQALAEIMQLMEVPDTDE